MRVRSGKLYAVKVEVEVVKVGGGGMGDEGGGKCVEFFPPSGGLNGRVSSRKLGNKAND